MNIIMVDVSDIVPYDNNPRNNEDAVQYVLNSINQFGFKVPIILDKNNVIIAGHTRYEAAKRLQMKELPAIYANDLSDEQVKAFRIADNKVGEMSSWDFKKLAEELEKFQFDFNFEDFGFSETELDIFKNTGGNIDNLDSFVVQDEQKKTKHKMVTCPHCGEKFEV